MHLYIFLGKRGGKVCIGLSEGGCNSLNTPNPYCRGLRIVNNSSHWPHSETPSALSSFLLFLITCKEFRCRQFQHHGAGAEVSSGGSGIALGPEPQGHRVVQFCKQLRDPRGSYPTLGPKEQGM